MKEFIADLKARARTSDPQLRVQLRSAGRAYADAARELRTNRIPTGITKRRSEAKEGRWHANQSKSLPELSREQRFKAALLGGRALEKFTREQMSQAVEANLDGIINLIGRPEEGSGVVRKTNRLELGDSVIPAASVELEEVDGQWGRRTKVVFRRDPAEPPPPDEASNFVNDPTFYVGGEATLISTYLPIGAEPVPFDQQGSSGHGLAYQFTSEVLKAMQEAQEAGTLSVQPLAA